MPHKFLVSPALGVLMHDIGLPIQAVLRRARLPLDLFARDRVQLASPEYFRLWEEMARETGGEVLPIRLVEALRAESFEPAIFAAMCSPDLNTALERIGLHKRLLCPMALHIDARSDRTSLEIEWLDKSVEPPPSLVLTELTFFVQLARMGTRERVEPREIRSHLLPTDAAAFKDFFGGSVRRGRRPGLVFSAEDASRPFVTSNPGMWSFFEPELRRRITELDAAATTKDRVRTVLLELLPGGSSSTMDVAKRLGTSKRTLQRRLKDEGLLFTDVLNETREALALHYLKSSAMTGTEISFLLGYEDPNSFSRAFNSWTGATPEKVRRQLLSAP